MKPIKRLLAIALIGALAIVSVACDNGETEGAKLTFSVEKLEFPGTGGTQTVTVTGGEWIAVPSEDWIDVVTEGDLMTVTVGVNPNANAQSGSINVKSNSDSKDIAVVQASAGETGLSVSRSKLEFHHQGGTETITVTSAREWTATPSHDWIEIMRLDDGTGFEVILAPNEEPRVVPEELNGTITVSNGVTSEDKTITVWQALGLKALLIWPHNVTVIFPDGTIQLEITALLPDNASNKLVHWKSLDESIVTVDAQGNLTPVGLGTTTVTVTSDDTDAYGNHFVDDCLVVVAHPWTPGVVTFRTDRTWEVGYQIWSDVVLSEGSDKDTFTGVSGNTYIPDGMRNGDFGHMFSWATLVEFGEELCPAPWRVPSNEDFVALDIALGGSGSSTAEPGHEDKYRNQWGLEWSGQAFNSMISGGGIGSYQPILEDGTLLPLGADDAGNGARFWATNADVGNRSMAVHLALVDNDIYRNKPFPNIDPSARTIKQYGFPVRCVKDK